MSQSPEKNPLVVATQRLLEKQSNVSEQLSNVGSHVEGLETLESALEVGLHEALEQVQQEFSFLADAVDQKKSQFVHSLREAVSDKKCTIAKYKEECQSAITHGKEVSVYTFPMLFPPNRGRTWDR